MCIKHMDKHTDTHICSYDTHVDRMKDGKRASVKQKACDHFPTKFYPFACDVGPVRFEGIPKEQEISFMKRNKTGVKYPLVLPQTLGEVNPELVPRVLRL